MDCVLCVGWRSTISKSVWPRFLKSSCQACSLIHTWNSKTRRPHCVYCRKGKEHNITDLVTETVDFIRRRESSAVKQALTAVTACDALALKREIRLPVRPETRESILALEDQILTLTAELLHTPSPDQLTLPGMQGRRQWPLVPSIAAKTRSQKPRYWVYFASKASAASGCRAAATSARLSGHLEPCSLNLVRDWL
jgi:hypothetical protein